MVGFDHQQFGIQPRLRKVAFRSRIADVGRGPRRHVVAVVVVRPVARQGEQSDEGRIERKEHIERHLDHEERELEPLLIPHFESEEWKEVERKLRKEPPKVAGQFFAWLTDGMSDEGRSYLKSTVPRPVVSILGHVFGRRYHKNIAPVWHAGVA